MVKEYIYTHIYTHTHIYIYHIKLNCLAVYLKLNNTVNQLYFSKTFFEKIYTDDQKVQERCSTSLSLGICKVKPQ